jgi:acyl carrier protein
MLASTSVCFDLSIFEIFLPLATGNTVLLVQDVLELPTFPHREKVTLINTVPSAMNALLQTQLPPAVQTVCMAGEFLPTELVDRVYAAGARQVFDLYGPTETTTYSTFTLRLPGEPANIGGPIANTRLYLLDENLSQVPAGAIGEIFIGGEGVARGYLDRPELTTERFLTLPAIEPHSRLYRTGDLARLRSDGTYIYLGRRDQQVKLRGYRIELGEVESALRESTGASDVAVVVQSRPSGEILVAFVADGESKRIDPAECAAALRKRLPAYMVPALIVPIAELPRTPNGKTDRKALSQTIAADAHHKSEPPADLLEQWLANIWAARLDQKQVARNAHFFDDLGGHSLAAFEIFAEIESRIGVALGLATLFQAPSVELLAGAIRRHEWKEPRHLRLLSSGVNSKVIYVVGHPASADPQAIRNLDGRVMAIDANGRSDQLEDSLREMIRFEATKPSIVLASAPATLEEARRLATKLAHAGFSDVSLHTI